MLDPYEILDVPRGASSETVHRAFKKAVQKHHPDKNPGDPRAAERLRSVIAAYHRLRGSSEGTRARPFDPSAPLHVVTSQLRGADLHATVEVDGAARAAGWMLLELAALDACPSCNGRGHEEVASRWGITERWECEACRGTALVSVRRKVRLKLPARLAPRSRPTTVRLRGIGLPRAGVARGDAFVTLRPVG